MLNLLNVNKIESIFADIDGSTRGDKFARKLPSIARMARLVLNIPIFPVTGRDLNGWFLIKDYNKVFGTRRTTIPIKLPQAISTGLGRRRLYRPETNEEIKKFIKKFGCIVTNNGGTISSLDGQVVFRHYPFTVDEKKVLFKLIEDNFDEIISFDLGNPPGRTTLHYVINADGDEIERIRKLHKHEPNIEFIPLFKFTDKEDAVSLEQFKEIFFNYRTSKILIGTKSEKVAEKIVEVLDSHDIEVTANEGGLAVTTRGVNKRSAIEWIARHMGINLNHSVFIGNDHNDTPAFTIPELGHSIFVGDPVKVMNKRLITKYGEINSNALLVETYDDLYKQLRPLLLRRKKSF